MSAAPKVKCPTCGAMVVWTPDATWRPFCSERCKQADLGAWASEHYAIPAVQAPASDPLGDDAQR